MSSRSWTTCRDPRLLLEWVSTSKQTSARKLRLFGCALCRQLWNLLPNSVFQNAIEIAEKFADGLVDSAELAGVRRVSGAALEQAGLAGTVGLAYRVLSSAWSTTRNPETAALYPLNILGEDIDMVMQERILRDIFPSPFREQPVMEASWLAWNGGTVVHLAQAIYDDRELPSGQLDSTRLAILADSLEDAGCTDADILEHCRRRHEHWRGCHVLDLLLKKN